MTIRSGKCRFRVGGDDRQVRGLETPPVTLCRRGTSIVTIRVAFQSKVLPKVAFKAL